MKRRIGAGMPTGRYAILSRRQAAMALTGLFLMAVAVVTAAALVPRVYAGATADRSRRLPISCTDRPGPVVSLTFDAAWGEEDLPALLAVLAEHKVPATFFVTGDWAARCPEAVQALRDGGHEVMSLSDSHAKLPALSAERMLEEIRTANDRIQALTGTRPTLLRAPFGAWDDRLLALLDSLGMRGVQGDVDSLDSTARTAEEVVRQVLARVSSGSIVQFRVGAPCTPEALAALLPALRERGYTFLPVTAMLYDGDVPINGEGRQLGGYTNEQAAIG